MLFEQAIANPRGSRALQQQFFSLLETCSSVKNLTQIHSQVIVNGFSQKNFIIVKLLSFYVISGKFLNARKVFQSIENPSTWIWNQIIRTHAQSETPQKSIKLYNQMVAAEAEPDGYTYSFLLSGCVRSGLLREGEQVHGKVLANGYYSNLFVQTNLVNLYAMEGHENGVGYARRVFDDMGVRNTVTWNSLLVGYIRCGDFDQARRMFDDMPNRNVVSWTTMIAWCAQNGKCKQALSLFNEMRRSRVELDQVVLVAALSACAELGDLNLGRWIHLYIEQKLRARSEPLLVSLNNALIHMYASCGMIEEAYEVLRNMNQRSTVSWTTMIMGFAKQGYANEALAMFEQMQTMRESEGRPDEITFIAVLCACSYAGLVKDGLYYFKCMNSWGIKQRIEHYGCMIDLLSRAGFLNEACNLIETMPMKPNDAIWGALLGGCIINKNYELASFVAKKLIVELEPDRVAGYLVLFSNVYATAKRWHDVVVLREKMVDMGVKKPAGRSWVQINGVVHDFVANDTTHKHASLVYKMLGEITKQAMNEGYKPEILEVFLQVEERGI